MKKLIAMLLVAALALMGCAFAETANEGEESAINVTIAEGSFIVQIDVEDGDEGWVASDMSQDDSVLKLYDADVIENTFVARYDPVGDGTICVTVKHMDGNVCDRAYRWDVTVVDGATKDIVALPELVAPDEATLTPLIAGEWQVNDNIMAGMTITKNDGKGWALQIGTAYPGVYVFQADLFYDCELDTFVYTGGKVYRSEITNTPKVVLGELLNEDAGGSLRIVKTDDGETRLVWHNELSPEEDAQFYRPEDIEEPMAEGADSDWYMNVLADPDLSRQFPYHAFADVNGNGVPVLVVSTTESAFIGAEDQARVYVYADGEPKQVMELGRGGGEKLYCNPDSHTLTHFSRLSGEGHLEVYSVKDGALELVTTVDNYSPHHSPEEDNAEAIYLQDGKAITEAELDALYGQYAGDDEEISYEKQE